MDAAGTPVRVEDNWHGKPAIVVGDTGLVITSRDEAVAMIQALGRLADELWPK